MQIIKRIAAFFLTALTLCAAMPDITYAAGETAYSDSWFVIQGSLSGDYTLEAQKYNKFIICDCNELTGLKIKEGVKGIQIRNCKSLKSLAVPAGVEEMTIDDCHSLATVTIDKNNKNYVSVYNSVYSKDYRTLYFYGGINDEEIKLQQGLYDVGVYAFSSCNNVKKITIPESVYYISDGAFRGLDTLETIEVSEDNMYYSTHNGDFYHYNTLIRCFQSGDIIIWEGTDYIQRDAFSECRNVESIDMPEIEGCKVVKAGDVCDVSWDGSRQYNFFMLSDKKQFYTVSKEDDDYFLLYDDVNLSSCYIPCVSRLVDKGNVEYFGIQPKEDMENKCATVSFKVTAAVELTHKQKFNPEDTPEGLYSFTPDKSGKYIMRYDQSGRYALYDEDFNFLNEDQASYNLDLSDTGCNSGSYSLTGGQKYYYFIQENSNIKEAMVAHDDTVKSFSVSTPPDRKYYPGENKVNLAGLSIDVQFADGTSEVFTYDRSWDCYAGESGSGREIYVRWSDDTIENGRNTVWIYCYDKYIEYDIPTVNMSLQIKGNWLYYEKAGNTAEIVGYSGYDTEIEVLETIDGLKVTSIGSNAFSNNRKIRKVTLPDSVESIGINAFYGCDRLAEINLSRNIHKIGASAFQGCALTDVTLPSLSAYSSAMFKNCISLKNVVLPEDMTEISYEMFMGCISLEHINIPSSVKELGTGAFAYCKSLTDIDVDNYLFTYKDGSLYFMYQDRNTLVLYNPAASVIDIRNEKNIAYYALTSVGHVQNIYFSEDIPNINEIKTGVTYTGNYDLYGNDRELLFRAGHSGIYRLHMECDKKYTIYDYDPSTPVYTDSTTGDSYIYLDKDEVYVAEFYMQAEEKSKTSYSFTITDVSEGRYSDDIGYRVTDDGLSFYGTGTLGDLPEIFAKAERIVFEIGMGGIIGAVHPDGSRLKTLEMYGASAVIELTDLYKDSMTPAWRNGILIRGLAGSRAEKYAKDNGLRFEKLSKADIPLADPALKPAENTESGIKVRWNGITGATGYIVYRKSAGHGWSRIAVIQSSGITQYTDTKVTGGVTYTYTVRATCGDIISGWNSTSVIKRLSCPEIKSVSNITSGIQLKWNRITGAGGYILYRKNSGGTYTRIADIKNGSTTSYTDGTAKTGTSYTYTVRAYSGIYMSTWRNPKTITRLADPAVNSAVNLTEGIQVSYGRCAGASGYIIYRRNSGGTWSRIARVNGNNVLSYIDRSAKPGITYDYTVRAYKGNMMSNWKNYRTTRRIPDPVLKSAASSAYGISVKWNKSSYAAGYIVYRKSGKGGWQRIASINNKNATGFTDTTAGKGITYTYTIRAYYGKYLSDWHSVRSAKR